MQVRHISLFLGDGDETVLDFLKHSRRKLHGWALLSDYCGDEIVYRLNHIRTKAVIIGVIKVTKEFSLLSRLNKLSVIVTDRVSPIRDGIPEQPTCRLRYGEDG